MKHVLFTLCMAIIALLSGFTAPPHTADGVTVAVFNPLLLGLLAAGALFAAMGGKKQTGGDGSTPPSLPFPPGPSQTQPTQLPPNLQQIVANALAANTPPALTAAAFAVEQFGFTELGAELRRRANQAAQSVPRPPPVQTDSGMPPDLAAEVARQLQLQADPTKLEALSQELRKRGFTAAADLLDAKAKQLRAAIDGNQVMQTIDTILSSPGIPQPRPPGPGPSPAPGIPPSILDIPPMVAVPPFPIPQPLPAEKSPNQLAAENMVRNLLAVLTRVAGNVKTAKGKEDKTLVKKFQASEGDPKPDGLYGPGTAIKAAKYVGALPPVFYWPKSATKATVAKYQHDLLAMAQQAASAGDLGRSAALNASASLEKGQGGIV